WMPNVVLIAKNIYVWLDQLSKKYRREIKRLDQIPDEELDQLARWNFNGLWLIGVWERSHASKRIKQINGNSDAVSSAYSLFDYEIAYDLGGEDAFQNLNHRARERGIRLAGDMVPNHMGLFSKWVIEHPEYFIHSDKPPYPGYRFSGHNLSDDPNIELRIEDGYWNKNDAAVVFQRIDRRNGDVRYIYHGNDGTNMPWNDTAQLNLLRADVREAIIQNIFHVARKFSIIRFDAAMTLAKKHFQRLWYPMPGTSGVPSRQDFGLTRGEFENHFPNEFWREVVDRINSDMPHTLLLAEAFWLMEGYFVRTLGMHRVYNSAFMHMLMKEENEKFRSLIKNTLEFNSEILKRYVNFMSNPDEETAVSQFGKDDKYFGVATVMVTLPGLPMFAHGQIEGFTEKYGMEYQRAYYNETADEWFVRRHEHEIFPLTKKRYLFSHVQDFEFYDFHDDRGYINENVFAYSNRSGDERAIIFFHNKFEDCRGWINHSVVKATNKGEGVRSITLGDGLQIDGSEKIFYRFRERKLNLEYLMSGKDIRGRGFWMELRAFQYAVFTDFVKIYDANGDCEIVAYQLNGRGATNVDQLLREVKLKPLHDVIKKTFTHFQSDKIDTVSGNYGDIFTKLSNYLQKPIKASEIKDQFTQYLASAEKYFTKEVIEPKPKHRSVVEYQLLFASLYRLIYDLEHIIQETSSAQTAEIIFQRLHLDDLLVQILVSNDREYFSAKNDLALLKVLLRHKNILSDPEYSHTTLLERLFDEYETANFLNVNLHQDVWYFNKEQYEVLIQWILSLRFIFTSLTIETDNPYLKEWNGYRSTIDSLIKAARGADYKVEILKEMVSIAEKPQKTNTTASSSNKKKSSKLKSGTIKKKSPPKQNKRKKRI
ncbi:MAG: alpha-amylase family glycosyl hydrolase, partial [Bacteroidota bacterium]|nr:alpha-amylase family glycosyl hydrolase [Bacteroidota bacterium]